MPPAGHVSRVPRRAAWKRRRSGGAGARACHTRALENNELKPKRLRDRPDRTEASRLESRRRAESCRTMPSRARTAPRALQPVEEWGEEGAGGGRGEAVPAVPAVPSTVYEASRLPAWLGWSLVSAHGRLEGDRGMRMGTEGLMRGGRGEGGGHQATGSAGRDGITEEGGRELSSTRRPLCLTCRARTQTGGAKMRVVRGSSVCLHASCGHASRRRGPSRAGIASAKSSRY